MIPDEAVEAASRAAVEQLALYTLPANFDGGNAYHEEVAARCGPIIAKAVLEAAIPHLTMDSEADAWDEAVAVLYRGNAINQEHLQAMYASNPYRKSA